MAFGLWIRVLLVTLSGVQGAFLDEDALMGGASGVPQNTHVEETAARNADNAKRETEVAAAVVTDAANQAEDARNSASALAKQGKVPEARTKHAEAEIAALQARDALPSVQEAANKAKRASEQAAGALAAKRQAEYAKLREFNDLRGKLRQMEADMKKFTAEAEDKKRKFEDAAKKS